ncbi:hypothetical protein ACSSVY_004288 [Roseovarius sp. MBR-51]
MCRRFGLVAQAGPSLSGKLRQDLHALGWDGQRPVNVISDGEPARPNLVRAAVDGRVRHILDWWHISMRLQHIKNAVKGLLQTENFPGFPELFKRPAETLRWCLWHGKIMTAGTRLKLLIIDSGRATTEDATVRVAAARVKARCQELYTYLANNWDAPHQLRLATSQWVFDFIVSGGGMCRRHWQRADGQEPQDAMVTERGAQCRRYQSSRSRWSIVRFKPGDGRSTPNFCPLPSEPHYFGCTSLQRLSQ